MLPAETEENEDIHIAQFANHADDDRDLIEPGDPVLLIVENDLGFAKVLLEVAREQG